MENRHPDQQTSGQMIGNCRPATHLIAFELISGISSCRPRKRESRCTTMILAPLIRRPRMLWSEVAATRVPLPRRTSQT